MVQNTAPFGLKNKDMAVRELKEMTKNEKTVFVSIDGFPTMETGFGYLMWWHKVNSQDVPGAVHYEIRFPALAGDIVIGEYGLRKVK